jgi:hypothetical protein
MILTKIYINNEQIDLKEDVSIPLNFNIADIREPEKRSTTWSKTVILPGTTFNNDLFSNIWNVNAVINSTGTTNFSPNFNPNLKAQAEITYNEAIQFKGICQLLNVNVTDKYEIEYEVAFFGELQNVYQFFNNKYLRDLDFSEYNHKYTLYNQELSWGNTSGFCYPMIDFGFGINSQFKVTEMFPALYVKTIIDKMFLDAGFSYSSSFFETQLFKKLIIPYSGASTLKLTAEQVRDRTMRASKTATQSIINNNSGTVTAPEVANATRLIYPDKTTPPNFDDGNNWFDQQGGVNYQTYVVPKSGTYNLTAFIKANVTHLPSTATADLTNSTVGVGMFAIYKNSIQVIANIPCYMKQISAQVNVDDSFMFTASNSTTLPATLTSGTTSLTSEGQLSITTYLAQNDIIQIKYANFGSYNQPYQVGTSVFYSIYSNSGTKQEWNNTSKFQMNVLQDSFFSVQLTDTNIQEGDDVEVNVVLPDKIKQSDFFNSIIKAFNLFVEVDKGNPKKLLIEPRPTFYASGTTRDWSYKLDYSKETKIIPLGELNNKTYLFTYAEDTDFFNADYKTTYNEVYGQRKYEVLNDFLKGEVVTQLIFSPTPLVNTIGHDRVISKIYTLDANGTIKPTQSNIRLLYWGGLKPTNNAWQHIATSGTTSRNDFPYAGHLDDVNNPTFDLNFGVPNQVYYTAQRYTANNLYNKYWRDYIEQISDKDSKIFSGYFLLNEFDIQSLDFRDLFFFENEYWRLNKIIDYDRVMNQPTKCEFIKLKTLPNYTDDSGIDINGGSEDLDNLTPAPTARGIAFNNNYVAIGALVSGRNNLVQSGDGVIVSGQDNVVGVGSKNVTITSSTGVTVLGGVSNISVTNSSGLTVSESNVTYNNGIKTNNNVSYKHYIALLYQSGITAPTAYVLENTLSNLITWTRNAVGEYEGTLTGEFTQYKTSIYCNNTFRGEIVSARKNNNVIEVYTYDSDGNSQDDALIYTTIEIRVYN